MAHLTDMEELLASISLSDVRDYMREAMNCYMAGAYRGCVVLSYIALFDDLLDKLYELGKVNKSAKKIYKEASKRKSDQEVFESYLIDHLGSAKLLSGLDVTFLNVLRTLRNKSAHPSGHQPSPEEARYTFFEVIDRFLSQPILTTTQLVDELVDRLRNKNFFPTIQISDIKEVVDEEIKGLHDIAYPQLIAKLMDKFISSDKKIASNAGLFLVGLAVLDRVDLNDLLKKKVIQKKSDDSDYYLLVLKLIVSNGKLFCGLSNAGVKRIRSIYSERIDSVKISVNETNFSHPTAVFVSLSSVLSDGELVSIFSAELTKLFKTMPYSNFLIDALIGLPNVSKIYFEQINKKAGSNDFNVANKFAGSIEYIDEYLAKIISNKDAFEMIISVLSAAEWGAFGAQGLRRTKFARTPFIKTLAKKYLNGHKRKSKSYIKDKLDIDMTISEFLDEYLSSDEDE